MLKQTFQSSLVFFAKLNRFLTQSIDHRKEIFHLAYHEFTGVTQYKLVSEGIVISSKAFFRNSANLALSLVVLSRIIYHHNLYKHLDNLLLRKFFFILKVLVYFLLQQLHSLFC